MYIFESPYAVSVPDEDLGHQEAYLYAAAANAAVCGSINLCYSIWLSVNILK